MAGDAKLIVKRVAGEEGHSHHGGAWKVAYADFVTAMMAFFLLLWLLNATTEEQRAGLADYFDPSVPISPVSGGGSGVLGGADPFSRRRLPREAQDGVRPETPDPEATEAIEAALAEAEARQAAAAALDAMTERLDAAAAGHLAVRAVPEGLVIELVDLAGEPLFATGSARPTPLLATLAEGVAEAIADLPNPVEILGHTDATPFGPGAGRTNWELSAERAGALRRLMAAAGLDQARVRAVTGRAATEPFAPDPLAPENRRVAVKLIALPPATAPALSSDIDPAPDSGPEGDPE